jgi:hypothetical protein
VITTPFSIGGGENRDSNMRIGTQISILQPYPSPVPHRETVKHKQRVLSPSGPLNYEGDRILVVSNTQYDSESVSVEQLLMLRHQCVTQSVYDSFPHLHSVGYSISLQGLPS